MVCCRYFKSLEGGIMSMFLALMNIIWPFLVRHTCFGFYFQNLGIFSHSSGHLGQQKFMFIDIY